MAQPGRLMTLAQRPPDRDCESDSGPGGPASVSMRLSSLVQCLTRTGRTGDWTKATMILVAVLESESPVRIPRPGGGLGSGFAGLGLPGPAAFGVSDSDEPTASPSHRDGHGHRDSGYQSHTASGCGRTGDGHGRRARRPSDSVTAAGVPVAVWGRQGALKLAAEVRAE